MGNCLTCGRPLFCNREIESIDYWLDFTGVPSAAPTGTIAVEKTLDDLGGSFTFKVGCTDRYVSRLQLPPSGYGYGTICQATLKKVNAITVVITGIPGELTTSTRIPLDKFFQLDGTPVYSRSGSTHTWVFDDARSLLNWHLVLSGKYRYESCPELIDFTCLQSLVSSFNSDCYPGAATPASCQATIRNGIVGHADLGKYPELVADDISVGITVSELNEECVSLNEITEVQTQAQGPQSFGGGPPLTWNVITTATSKVTGLLVSIGGADVIECRVGLYYQQNWHELIDGGPATVLGSVFNGRVRTNESFANAESNIGSAVVAGEGRCLCCRENTTAFAASFSTPLIGTPTFFGPDGRPVSAWIDSECKGRSQFFHRCAYCHPANFSFTGNDDNKLIFPRVFIRVNWGEPSKCASLGCPGSTPEAITEAAETITYSLLPDVSEGVVITPDPFQIDSATGVVTVRDGALLNAESREYWNIVVQAETSLGAKQVRSFRLRVLDVDEFDASTISNADGLSVMAIPSAPVAGTLVGLKAFSIDRDATNNAIVYSLANNAGGRFAINSSSGIVTATGSGSYSSPFYDIEVLATSSDGSSKSRVFRIAIDDSVLGVRDGNAAASVTEGSGATDVTVQASETSTYSLTGLNRSRFNINASSGVVSFAAGVADFEQRDRLDVQVTARSNSTGNAITRIFTVRITDVANDVLITVADSVKPISIPVTAPVGSKFAISYGIVDFDYFTNRRVPGNPVPRAIYTKAPTQPDSAFAACCSIDAINGELVISTSFTTLSVATPAVRQLRVLATDIRFPAVVLTLTISVTLLNKYEMMPIVNTGSGLIAIAEGSPAGSEVGLTARSQALIKPLRKQIELTSVEFHYGDNKIILKADKEEDFTDETAVFGETFPAEQEFRWMNQSVGSIDTTKHLVFSATGSPESTSGCGTLQAYPDFPRFTIDGVLQKVAWVAATGKKWSQDYNYSFPISTFTSGQDGVFTVDITTEVESEWSSTIAHIEHIFLASPRISVEFRRLLNPVVDGDDGGPQLQMKVTYSGSIVAVRRSYFENLSARYDFFRSVRRYVPGGTDTTTIEDYDCSLPTCNGPNDPTPVKTPESAIRDTRDTRVLPPSISSNVTTFPPVAFSGDSGWLDVNEDDDFSGRIIDFGDVTWVDHSTGPTSTIPAAASQRFTCAGLNMTGFSLNQFFTYAMPTSMKRIKVKLNGSVV
jgi:hypothetical protein